jgi:hypothetical protein
MPSLSVHYLPVQVSTMSLHDTHPSKGGEIWPCHATIRAKNYAAQAASDIKRRRRENVLARFLSEQSERGAGFKNMREAHHERTIRKKRSPRRRRKNVASHMAFHKIQLTNARCKIAPLSFPMYNHPFRKIHCIHIS